MVTVTEVKNKKQMRSFVRFVLDLYKGNPYYVPYMYSDEMNMMNPKVNVTLKDCEAKYYLAYKDGKIAGRIGAVLQKVYNARSGKKSVRFTRFDCIDDSEVAKALTGTVEDFARSYGMSLVFGPYGFNETDRAGYLCEGFDIPANFGTNYNFPYYDTLLQKCGYEKDAEWVEIQSSPNDTAYERFKKLSDFASKKFHFRIAQHKTFKAFAKEYGWKAFQCFNDAYAELPGFVPFTEDLYNQIKNQFAIVAKMKYLTAVIDAKDNVVGFAVCFPSLARAMQKTGGRLFPFGFIPVLKAINSVPESLDLCLIGVVKEYQNKGVNASLIYNILRTMKEEGIKITEAYPELEDNEATIAQWESFNGKITKRRRVVKKTISLS